MSSRMKQMASALCWNIATLFRNIFIKRDKRVVLIGAWMGVKFADNSRYLFQYLHKKRGELGIKKVIWVTRNSIVNQMLINMGYDSFIIGTKESNYWHVKAGIHIVCNAVNDIANFHADIDTKLSFGAKKIQLWHGVGGIKAVGGASNLSKSLSNKDGFLKKIIRMPLVERLFSPGGWRNAFILSTGKDCASAMIAYTGCRENRIFISGYPRNCQCIKLLDQEKELLIKLKEYNGSILYLPTFRSDNSQYVHPLNDKRIRDYIDINNILWIEKPHTADLNKDAVFYGIKNVCNLDSSFDINVIYNDVTCVITDYSSVAFDAVYHKRPLVMYAPDIELFENGDVGFLIDFVAYFQAELCENLSSLFCLISEALENSKNYVDYRKSSYQVINQYGFDNKVTEYDQIWNDIIKL